MKKLYILLIISLISGYSYAQFNIDVQLRPRGEVRNGYKNLPEREDLTAYLISQRTRLGFTYSQELYKIRINIQDVRIWGDETLYSSTAVYGDNASLDLYEGWLWLRMGSNYFMKIGRQEWAYEDQRLLSKRNWNQNGGAYDGVLFGYNKEKLQIDLGLSMNNDKDNTFGNEYTPDKMKFLNYIYLNSKISSSFNLSFLGIFSGNQKEEGSNTVYALGTFGPYVKFKKDHFSAQANVYYQTGTNIKSEKVSAYLFNLKANYNATEKINFGAGFDYISGNDQSENDTKDHSFDLLYGTRHGFNGEMDLYSNLVKSTLDAGLIDIFASYGVKLNPKNSIQLTYHNFRLQNTAYKPDTEEKLKKQLGNELDFNYKYKPEIPMDLTVGICLFQSTESMKIIQGVSDGITLNYYTYVMLTFTPELFSTK